MVYAALRAKGNHVRIPDAAKSLSRPSRPLLSPGWVFKPDHDTGIDPDRSDGKIVDGGPPPCQSQRNDNQTGTILRCGPGEEFDWGEFRWRERSSVLTSRFPFGHGYNLLSVARSFCGLPDSDPSPS